MNLDSLSLALSEISYLVDNLTKKNYKASQLEIAHLVGTCGTEADRHLLRCLFSHVDFSGDGKSSGKDFHQTQFLIQECTALITKPNFISTLCYAIDNPLHYQKSLRPSAHVLSQFGKVLKLSKVQEVVFGLALLNSCNRDLQSFAEQFVKQKLPDLLRSYVDSDVGASSEGGFQDIAIEVLHLLLSQLLHGSHGSFGVGQEQLQAFLQTLRKDFPRARCPVVLSPLLYREHPDLLAERLLPDTPSMAKTPMEASLADLMQEVGYSCCASIEECRNLIVEFGAREVNATQVARVLSMMAGTHSSLTDGMPLQSICGPGGSIWSDGKDKGEAAQAHTWNVEMFIEVVKDPNLHINFKEVMYELDHPGFLLKDAKGLQVVVYGIQKGLGMDVLFPVELVYRPWKCTEGQLSFIQNSLLNPDIFCFADYGCHPVVTDILKAPPEEDNRDIATWKSLDLIESLLRLAESGHYEQVKQLFSFPIKHCPDLLILSLLQISSSWNTLRHELISMLMPVFLGNHPNSAIILHYAWHGQGQSPAIRQLVMHAMAEWYMRVEQYDQTRLSRILDVAQDLKALSMLLNATPFAFVIDLAVLASRREYLKLDKWLTDKIREHGEPFIQACVSFLKRRCPTIMGGLPPEKEQPKSAQLPPETLSAMLVCLQACAGSVMQELSETILTMVANCSNVMNKARQPPPGVMPKGRAPNTSTLDNISPVQLEALTSMASLNITGASTNHATSIQPFPPNLGAGFNAPSSPAKAFPQLSGTNQSPFSALSSLSTQLPVPGLGSGALGGMSNASLGLQGVGGTDPFVQRKLNLSGINPQSFQQTDLSQVSPEMSQQFSKEIDDEANSYFQRIYNQPPHPTMSVDEVGYLWGFDISMYRLSCYNFSNRYTGIGVLNIPVYRKKENTKHPIANGLLSPPLKMKEVMFSPLSFCLCAGYLKLWKDPDEIYDALSLQVLLTSDKQAANFSDRSLLKNLGHWLGMVTLAKNKPILQIDIDVKALLLEAYGKGQQELLYVVPFVAKVLESCSKSLVFRPPNPWTMAIMNVLAELHQETDLKLNLKFEIEVLCKTLSIDINELKPSSLLKDKDRLKILDEQLSAPKKETKILDDQQQPMVLPAQTTIVTSGITTTTTTGPPQPQFSFYDINVYSLAGLSPHITISPNIALFQAHPQLKQYVRPSLERAVQELVHPVVERSIKIAMTTCEQIARKDFALDPEESRMRAAAQHMMRNLTAGMAMITCREPLLLSITSNLKNNFLAALRGSTMQQKEMIELATNQLAQDNCELACCFIQKMAVEKAGPEMDKRLATVCLWTEVTVFTRLFVCEQIFEFFFTFLHVFSDFQPPPKKKFVGETRKQILCLLECREEYKYNVEAVELLIRHHLVNLQQYDIHLAQWMENGLNYMAVAYAMQLVKVHLVDERSNTHVTEADFFHTIDALMRINAHSRGNAPEGLPQLMELIRANHDTMLDRAHAGPTFMMHSGISQAREYDDPPGLHEKAEYLLREWVSMYHSPAAGRDSAKAFSAFVGQMHQHGILKTDDLITRFFRLCTEMCVDLCYRALADQQSTPTITRAKCFHTLDAFVRLIALLVKHSGDASNTVTKINLLNKVLGIVVGVLLHDHDLRQADFQQLPYHRIFIMLLLELNAPEHVLESINFQTLTAFCNTFHILRPSKAPGFTFAWLELISHRIFIARMLAHTPQQKGWPMYAQLLIDLFKYLAPFLRNVELTKPMQVLYKGTLRVLLVLLHDFPEFLCDYHYGFCDVIPPNCIQLRNLILSAFPRNMRLPDPFTPNLKVTSVVDFCRLYLILDCFTNYPVPDSSLFRQVLKSVVTSELVSTEPGMRYNIPLINGLVLYVGTQAIAHINGKGSSPSMSTITHSAHMDIFQNLAVDLDTEGRYLFLNAIANQLRYPNSHTHYFSCTMLYLFAEANTEAIQEQITRLFQSVAQCCMGQKQTQQVMEGSASS
uniref:CCR4-NOT transcription complex, subunit 1 n=1 Tax=Eptatretus burgeri TaxID=7764 RepID=A0A8C4WXR9_EPTBU